MSDLGDAVAAGIAGLFLVGIAVGCALMGIGWLLWHFVLSHISIQWT